MKNIINFNSSTFIILIFLISLFPSTTNAQDGWSGLWRSSSQSHFHWYFSSWNSLMSKNSALKKYGYRMIDVESHYKNGSQKFYAIWKKDYSPNRHFKVVSEWSNFLAAKKEIQSSYSLIDIETYSFGGLQKFIGIWKKTNLSHSIGRYGQWSSLTSNYSTQIQKGYQIIDVEMYKNVDGQTKYIALFQKTGNPNKNRLFRHTSYSSFRSNRNNLASQGWLLIDYEKVNINNVDYYLSIFEKTSGKYSFYSNIDYLSFRAHRRQKASDNMQLMDMEVHQIGSPAFSPPSVYDYKVDLTPDLCQENSYFPTFLHNEFYCAPTSASNSLFYLAKDGFPNLNPYGTSDQDQVNMVIQLASNNYMDAEGNEGAGLGMIMKGLDKYIKAKGYNYQKMEAKGWRDPGDFSSAKSSEYVNIDFIKEGLLERSIVLLNIGWYKSNGPLRFERGGGHWVTAVGYGVDENGKTDPNIIIVHDPAKRSDLSKSQQHIKFEKLKIGKLANYGDKDYTGLPEYAKGYYRIVEDGIEFKDGFDNAILDAVVVLRME